MTMDKVLFIIVVILGSSTGYVARGYFERFDSSGIVKLMETSTITPTGNCQGLNIIPRADWGARDPKDRNTIGLNLTHWFIHHSDTPECNDTAACKERIRSIQNYHMDNKTYSDIGYSFLIGGDANVYEGRGWRVEGAHTYRFNDVGYGLCFIGNFHTKLPSAAAIASAMKLIECSVEECYVSANYKLFGHRQARNTTCPGDKLFDEIMTWPNFMAGNP